MKNLFALLICLSIVSLSIAQNSCINHFVDKYSGLEDATHLNISGNLLSFMKDDNDLRTTLTSLEVLSLKEPQVRATDIQTLHQGIISNNYEELIRVRDGKDLIHVFLTEKKSGVIDQLIVLVEGSESFTLLSLSGEIHYDDLKEMNFDGDTGLTLSKLPPRA
ncbi:MAG: DUF4252 domain-containing protein [Bacteroidota bacterium]